MRTIINHGEYNTVTQSMATSEIWSIPSWVSSRCYGLGTEFARAILTNARWWTNLVLEDDSARVWSLLPARFCLSDIGSCLRGIGLDLDDAESRIALQTFFDTLHSEGLLHCETKSPPTLERCKPTLDAAGVAANATEADFYDWLADRGILPSCLIEVTYRCNQRCVHCFNPGASRRRDERPSREDDGLTTRELCRVLEDLAEMGTFTVTFSGGEPTLRPDLLEVLTQAKSLGLSFNLFTNGLLDETLLHRICDLWPRTIGVSLYSPVPAIHDGTTGVTGSFDRALRSLQLIAKSGIRATMKCPLMQHTVHGYKPLLELCNDINALPQFDFQITAAIDGDDRSIAHQILDGTVLRMLMSDPHMPMHVSPSQAEYGRQKRPVDGPVCGAGRYTMSIAPDGTVYPCNGLPLNVGNVRTHSIRDVWESSSALAAWRSIRLMDFDQCGLYAHCSYCNHCPGMAMAETGNVLAVSKTCCVVARARMELSNECRGLLPDATTAASTFGFDSSIRLPIHPPAMRSAEAPPLDPRVVGIGKFPERILQIQNNGNPRRLGHIAELGSPEHENVKEHDLHRAGRLRELGR